MADSQSAEYPSIPVVTWWHLRKCFRRATPARVTRDYLVSALSSTVASIPKSTLPDLRLMGLVEAEGATTELGRRWGDDAHYHDVCALIRQRVYPAEIRELVHDQQQAASWFASRARVGQETADAMAALYLVLRDADLKKLKPLPAWDD